MKDVILLRFGEIYLKGKNTNGENDVISSSNEEILNTKDNGTFTALQNKINSASAGSTITLENDYVYDEGFEKYNIDGGAFWKEVNALPDKYMAQGIKVNKADVQKALYIFEDEKLEFNLKTEGIVPSSVPFPSVMNVTL